MAKGVLHIRSNNVDAIASTSLKEILVPYGTIFTDFLNLKDNIHKTDLTQELNLYRFYSRESDTESGNEYLAHELPAIDNHVMVFSVDNDTQRERVLSFDIRSTNIYTRLKENYVWGDWVKLLDSSNYSSVLDTSYVKKAGDTMTGSLTVQKTINGTSIATSWRQGMKNTEYSALNISDLNNNTGYCSWIRQTNPFEQKWFSMGIYKTSFYLIGSNTERTEDGYDHGLYFNIDDGNLKAPWFDGPVTHLGNYYRSGNNRPTSCDFPILGKGVSYFLATSSMTTNKPPNDAHCLHLGWDHDDGYDVQMGISHGQHPHIYLRAQSSGTWYPWRDVPCVYSGTSAPSNSTGSNGDIYIKYS